MTSPEKRLESFEREIKEYYRPDACERETRFPVDDPEHLNRALTTLESYLSKYLGICEARVLVCLILYNGLTYSEIQVITNMKQSAVSRTVTSLKEKRLIICRIGKKFEVGRPYQYVALNMDVGYLVATVRDIVSHNVEDMDYMGHWLSADASDDVGSEKFRSGRDPSETA